MGANGENVAIERQIGQRIGALRVAANETQEQLAEAMGVSREIIQHWESATRKIKAAQVAKLAKHFNTTADYILGVREYGTYNKSVEVACETTGLSQAAIEALQAEKKEYVDILSTIIVKGSLSNLLTSVYALSGYAEDAFDFASEQVRDPALQRVMESKVEPSELSERELTKCENACYGAMANLHNVKFGRYQAIEAAQDIADTATGVKPIIALLEKMAECLAPYLPESEGDKQCRQ